MSTIAPPNPTAPARSLQQRFDALANANHIRTWRAEKKREIRRDISAGRICVEQLLLEPPEEILTMKVFDLLMVVPRWGRVKVNKALSRAYVSPSKTVGGMTDRQRCELVAWMRGH